MTLDVRYWHEPADPERPLIGRYRVLSGRHMLNASSSHFDLKPTFLHSRCHGGRTQRASFLPRTLQRFDQNCGVCLNTFFGIIP